MTPFDLLLMVLPATPPIEKVSFLLLINKQPLMPCCHWSCPEPRTSRPTAWHLLCIPPILIIRWKVENGGLLILSFLYHRHFINFLIQGFITHNFTSGTTKDSRLILYFACSRPGVHRLSRAPLLSLSGEGDSETKIQDKFLWQWFVTF
jgi:hypothetical protein